MVTILLGFIFSKDKLITMFSPECLFKSFSWFLFVISAAKYYQNEMVVSFRAILAVYEKDDDEARKIFNLLEAVSA